VAAHDEELLQVATGRAGQRIARRDDRETDRDPAEGSEEDG
jgi:hypothetical protein